FRQMHNWRRRTGALEDISSLPVVLDLLALVQKIKTDSGIHRWCGCGLRVSWPLPCRWRRSRRSGSSNGRLAHEGPHCKTQRKQEENGDGDVLLVIRRAHHWFSLRKASILMPIFRLPPCC